MVASQLRWQFALGPGVAERLCPERAARSRTLTPLTLERLLEAREVGQLQERVKAALEANDEQGTEAILRHYGVLREAGIKFTQEQIDVLATKDYWAIPIDDPFYSNFLREKLISRLNKHLQCTEWVLLGELLYYHSALNEGREQGRECKEDLSWVGDSFTDETIMGCLDWMLYRPKTIWMGKIPSGLFRGLTSLLKDKLAAEKLVIKYLWDDCVSEHNLWGALEVAKVAGGLEMFITNMQYFHRLEPSLVQALVGICRERNDKELKERLSGFAEHAVATYGPQLDDSLESVINIMETIESLTPLDHSKFAELMDRYVQYRATYHEDIAPLCSIYQRVLNLSPQEYEERILTSCIRIHALDSTILALHKMEGSDALIYRLGLKFIDKGEYDKAFECFMEADLEQLCTNEEKFYKFIAQQAKLALDRGADSEKVKRDINKLIKLDLIKEIDRDKVNFGSWKVRFETEPIPGTSKNSAEFRICGAGRRVVPKTYGKEENFLMEKFMLRRLDDKIPIKRYVGESITVDDEGVKTYVIGIEASHGRRLTELDHLPLTKKRYGRVNGKRVVIDERHLDYAQKAAETAERLYQVVNQTDLRPELEKQGIPYHLDEKYIDERLQRFYAKVDDPALREQVRSMQRPMTDCLRANIQGLIHDDYTPQNLFVENEEIVVIDHEDYREGHPIMQVISLVTYPLDLPGLDTLLPHYAQKWNVDPELVKYATLFRCVRLAGSGEESKRGKDYDFFIGKLEEQL